MTPWWAGLLGTVVGTILGFSLTTLRDRTQRRQQRSALWRALRNEIALNGSRADGYVQGGVLVPAYRMRDWAFAALAKDGFADMQLTWEQLAPLETFYGNVAAFNLSLDQAQAALAGEREAVFREAGRAKVKAKKLRPGMPGRLTQYDSALAVADAFMRATASEGRWMWSRNVTSLSFVPPATIVDAEDQPDERPSARAAPLGGAEPLAVPPLR